VVRGLELLPVCSLTTLTDNRLHVDAGVHDLQYRYVYCAFASFRPVPLVSNFHDPGLCLTMLGGLFAGNFTWTYFYRKRMVQFLTRARENPALLLSFSTSLSRPPMRTTAAPSNRCWEH
jgi:hypothetical protein